MQTYKKAMVNQTMCILIEWHPLPHNLEPQHAYYVQHSGAVRYSEQEAYVSQLSRAISMQGEEAAMANFWTYW